jgi:RNA polymerase sigma-70 factor (ECF subfamily)
VFNYVRYRSPDLSTAEDLTAQVFEHLLTHIGAYRLERGPFAPWLFTLARNIVSKHHRGRQWRWGIPIEIAARRPDPDPGPEDITIQREREAGLLAAIARLGERERDLLGLKFAGRFNNRQIAEISGLSESNVAVILHRTIERLRKELGVAGNPESVTAGSPMSASKSASQGSMEYSHERA